MIGLGNPILGDDGVGWRLVELVRPELERLPVEVDTTDRGGLALMERLVGYDRALLLDAAHTGLRPAGTVLECRLEDLPNPTAGHLHSPHDTTLQSALEFGRRLGLHLPQILQVVAIEIPLTLDFSSTLTPSVEAGLPDAAKAVLDSVRGLIADDPQSHAS